MEGERVIEPLLYIDQPELTQKPRAYMQEDYSGKTLTTEQSNSKENKPNGSFKNLSIDEKIKYLVELRSEVPRIRCEVITDDLEYKGIITEANEAEITLRVVCRGHKEIQRRNISNINLIGFQLASQTVL